MPHRREERGERRGCEREEIGERVRERREEIGDRVRILKKGTRLLKRRVP